MRILGHIHTYNDDDVIDRSLAALQAQSRALDALLIVDNASTDATLDRVFPDGITVIRHPENRGTSGSVASGFEFALANGFDWIWLFDADSAPRPDALERLLAVYEALPDDDKASVWVMASQPIEAALQRPWHGARFGPRGPGPVVPEPGQQYCECDVTIWSGSLYKLSAVARIGLPAIDYVNDGGEGEYGYRGMRGGLRSLVVVDSLMDHNIRAEAPVPLLRRFGPVGVRVMPSSPMRNYYNFRNTVYFWLYEYHERRVFHVFREASRWPKYLLKLLLLSRWRELRACVKGLWHGLRGNMRYRY